MFIRFVTDECEDDTGLPLGIFRPAYRLCEDASVPEWQRSELSSVLGWFRTQLPIPNRFARNLRPHRVSTGLCWFNEEATDCIRQVCYLVQIVSDLGVNVREIRTERPGYIIYEDQFQVVAEPFAETPR